MYNASIKISYTLYIDQIPVYMYVFMHNIYNYHIIEYSTYNHVSHYLHLCLLYVATLDLISLNN